ncbi:MAG TPA: hypothetical protein VFA18_09645 [Gemmataceae bacterium]|nr:hypothetical protein [Gemmataceae bacterium]
MDDTPSPLTQPLREPSVITERAARANGGGPTIAVSAPAWQPDGEEPPASNLTDPLVRAEVRWLQTEKARLKTYLLELQAGLQQSQASAVNHRHRWEQQRVQTLQDLDSQRTALEAKRLALSQRETELSREAAEIEARYEPLIAAQKLLAQRQAQGTELEQTLRLRRQELDDLRVRTAREEVELRAARQQLASLAEEATAQRLSIQAEQAALAERCGLIETRYADQERAEETLQQRMHDWEEHESRTRRSFEEQQEQHAALRPLLSALEANPELRNLTNGWDKMPEHARRTVMLLLGGPG